MTCRNAFAARKAGRFPHFEPLVGRRQDATLGQLSSGVGEVGVLGVSLFPVLVLRKTRRTRQEGKEEANRSTPAQVPEKTRRLSRDSP